MSQIIFATINSFVGLPPVKQLLTHFRTEFNITAIQCVLDDHDDFFNEIGVRQDIIYRYKSTYQFKHQSLTQKLLKYLKLSKYLFHHIIRLRSERTIIFTPDLFTLTLSLLLKRQQQKVVYLQYEIIHQESLNKLDRFLLNIIKRLNNKIDLLITPEENRTQLLKNILSKHTTSLFFTLPNTNNNSFKVPEITSRKSNRIIITHIGAVGLTHNIGSFLEATSKLDASNYEVRFIGSLTDEVLALIKSYNCSIFKTIGQVKHSELKNYYLETDIGVILYKDVSLNHKFCAPNKLYEYWSYGIPVIGDELPGLISVFQETFLGQLVNMKESTEILNAIETLSNSEFNRQSILTYFAKHLKLDCYLDELNRKLAI